MIAGANANSGIIPIGEELPPLSPRLGRAAKSTAVDDADDFPPDRRGRKAGHRRKTADRFRALNAFVDCSMTDLTRAESLTWIVLYRDTRDGTACTSADDIARRIGASRRAVTTAIAGLRKRGLLTLIHRGGLNRGPSVYRVEPLARPP